MEKLIIHLEECEPEKHPEWTQAPYMEPLNAGGEMCPATEYMRDELFADEPVWVERVPDTRAEA